jgi:hypothetical protein
MVVGWGGGAERTTKEPEQKEGGPGAAGGRAGGRSRRSRREGRREGQEGGRREGGRKCDLPNFLESSGAMYWMTCRCDR